MNEKITDEELMMRVKENCDKAAFDEIVNRHGSGLKRYLVNMCRNEALAEDLVQDTFMKIFKKRDQFNPTGSFVAFLYRVAKNTFIDDYRKKERTPETSEKDPDELGPNEMLAYAQTNQPEDQLEHDEKSISLKKCVDKLKPNQSEYYSLKAETGLGEKEISKILGISYEAAKSLWRYTKSKLKDCLQGLI